MNKILGVIKTHDRAVDPKPMRGFNLGLNLNYQPADGKKLLVMPGETVELPTGIALAIPEGFYGDIRGKFNLNKRGLLILNSVLDENYTREVKLVMINHATNPYEINPGDEIGKILFTMVPRNKPQVIISSRLVDRSAMV